MQHSSPADPIVVSDVGVSFDTASILRGLSCRIEGGAFVAIVGPSGCGKSTLLRTMAGLIEPTHGLVSIGQMSAQDARKSATRLSFVFQDPTLLPWRTVYDNVALPMRLGATQPVDRDEILDALSLVGLGKADIRKRPSMLSGGMRMRVSIARALVTRPQVMLLDEPFAALDEILRQQLNEELLQIRDQRGCTMVFVTHNVSEAVFLSDRVFVMAATPGRIVDEVAIPFGKPRSATLRTTTEFAQQVARVSQSLLESAS